MPMTASRSVQTNVLAVPLRSSDDYRACLSILEEGSKSFTMASRILPQRIRPAVTGMYAFCRVADDMIDDGTDQAAAIKELSGRIDRLYSDAPFPDPVDRLFSQVIAQYGIPREILLGLLDGFDWDRQGRVYETLDDLLGYCARVASTVGVMMTLLMGPRDRDTLARACDLGLAMQLTNIARDVGEDAAAGRLYLPLSWLREVGIDPAAFLADPKFSSQLASVVFRLLKTAEGFYCQADLGISRLPRDSRVAIRAARLIYADIGREIMRLGWDSVSTRAYTTAKRKLWLSLRAVGSLLWRRRTSTAPPDPSVRFLVESVSDPEADHRRCP